MRKKLICILLLILSLSGCSKVSTKEMDVFSSTIEKNASETTLTITVILNRQISSQEYEDYARSIIDHCIKNNFKSVKFSYDLSGYPSSLDATVYATEMILKKIIYATPLDIIHLIKILLANIQLMIIPINIF